MTHETVNRILPGRNTIMSNFRDAFPSKYLKAADVTTPQVVTMDSVDFADVGTGKSQERKLVAHFVGVPKGLVLNLINSETIAEICGTDDFEKWPSHAIELYPTRTEFQGKRVPCLRIREPERQSRRAPAETRPERVPDWVDKPEAVRSEQVGRARDIDEVLADSPRG